MLRESRRRSSRSRSSSRVRPGSIEGLRFAFFAMWILLAAALRLAAVGCEQRIENRFAARVVDGERRRHAPLMHLAAHVAAQRVVVTGDDRRRRGLLRLRRAVAIDLLTFPLHNPAG